MPQTETVDFIRPISLWMAMCELVNEDSSKRIERH